MLYQEILWESLLSMHRFHNSQQKELSINQFKIKLLHKLANDLQSDPFQMVFDSLKEIIPKSDCFILKQINKDHAMVIKSTQTREIGYLWPLIGPLHRGMNGSHSIIFNASLIPVIKIFPLVVSNRITSMISSSFKIDQTQYLFLQTHKEKGFFNQFYQDFLYHITQLINQQHYRFKLYLVKSKTNQTLQAPTSSTSDDPQVDQVQHIQRVHTNFSLSDIPVASYSTSDSAHFGDVYLESDQQLANRYEMVKSLGEGGQAHVYQGYDPLINRRVALKIMKPSPRLSSSEQINQFIREASLAANISHSHVVRIFDLGFCSTHRHPFIVMEYLEGKNLHEIVKQEGKLSPSRLIPLMIPITEALGEAHVSGLVHRDLKPHNLFLLHPNEPREQVRVLDFGIAQFPDQIQEDPDSFVGTLSYLAPEYLKHKTVLPQSDVYQMGLILIELLTGEAVFKSKARFDFNLALDIGDGKINLSNELLQSPIGPILQKATALNPHDRFANGLELMQALKNIPHDFTLSSYHEPLDEVDLETMNDTIIEDVDKTEAIDFNPFLQSNPYQNSSQNPPPQTKRKVKS